MFDVRDLGTVGDGKTHDDDAFERALDDVAALSTASSLSAMPLVITFA